MGMINKLAVRFRAAQVRQMLLDLADREATKQAAVRAAKLAAGSAFDEDDDRFMNRKSATLESEEKTYRREAEMVRLFIESEKDRGNDEPCIDLELSDLIHLKVIA